MDARRLELYELLKPKIDEEPARALVLALPSEPDTLATKDFVTAAIAASEERLIARMDLGFAGMDAKFAGVDTKFAGMDARFAHLESTLTRRMVAIMGAWTVLLGSAFGWAAVLLR